MKIADRVHKLGLVNEEIVVIIVMVGAEVRGLIFYLNKILLIHVVIISVASANLFSIHSACFYAVSTEEWRLGEFRIQYRCERSPSGRFITRRLVWLYLD